MRRDIQVVRAWALVAALLTFAAVLCGAALRTNAQTSPTEVSTPGTPVASEVRDDTRPGRVGAMVGVTPQRTNAYETHGPAAQPSTVLWKSYRLFALKSVAYSMVETGPLRFELALPTDQRYSFPVVADGLIYLSVFNGDGYLLALDAANGTVRGKYKNAGTAVSALAVSEGVVYAGGSDGVFYAFDPAAESERWRVSDAYDFSVASPAVAGGVVYFVGFYGAGTGDTAKGIIYAVDAAAGRVWWSLKLKSHPSGVAVGGGAVCFEDGDGRVLALDARTGAERWRYKAGGYLSRPAVANDTVFFRERGGDLFALELGTGRLRWKMKSPGAGTLVALDGRLVYVGDRYDSLYALDAATGEQKWRFKTGKPCLTPVLAGGVVYAICGEKKLHALDAATGLELWQYKTEEKVEVPPIISNGVIYLLDEKAYLRAVR